MKNLQHFILTRFNVRVDYSKSRIGIQPDWLNHRFQLFDQFCYPSVRSQSQQNFQWLVFFDSETPEYFQNKIKKYAQWKNFIPIYVDGEFTNEINRETILRYLKTNIDYLITTRLDNDDAVSQNFVQLIQNHFQQQEFEFLNLTSGYVWHNSKLYTFDYFHNPFISLVEKIQEPTIHGFKTVICGQHTELSVLGHIKQIKAKPAWLQVIHEKNVSNRIRGIRQPIKGLADNFSIRTEYTTTPEKLTPYLLDKTFTLLKYPLESLVLTLPKDMRANLRKAWTNMLRKNRFV